MNIRLRKFQALCLALTLTFVPGMVCIGVIAGGYAAYSQIQAALHKSEVAGNSTFEILAVDNDGRAAVAVRDAYGKVSRYLDAHQRPIETANETNNWLVSCNLPDGRQPLHLFRVRREQHPVKHLDSVRGQGQCGENWFFVIDTKSGQGVFEGYDTINHRRIGFIGPMGFQEDPLDLKQAYLFA